MYGRFKQLLTGFAFLVFLTCGSIGAQEPSLADHPDVASRLRLLESWIETHMAHDGWPGLSIGIVHDQTLIYSRGFGYADLQDKTRPDERTLYPIASNTKMFTAIAILKLRDEGKLRLDDPVAKYLPWLDRIRNDYAAAGPVTVRQLLTHSSGLPREAAAMDWTGFYDPPLEEIIADIPGQAVVWAPGTRWKYSNLGVAILGAVVAHVAGMPYEQYVGTNILDPLGMKSSCFDRACKEAGVMATGYGRRMPDGSRQKMPAMDLKGVTPAGGLCSSVNDLALFASWQFKLRDTGGFEVIRASTLREMQRPHWLDPSCWKAATRPNGHWLDPSWMFAWGLGFFIYHKELFDLVGHGGHLPGYCTDFTVSPDDKVAMIVLANGDDIKVYPDQPNSISNRVYEWVVPALRKAVEGAPGTIADASLTRYVGKYRDWNADLEVLILDGKLVMLDPLNPPDPDDMGELVPIKDNTFRVDTRSGFAAPGELLVFEENKAGEIIGFKHSGSTLTRVSSW